MVARRVVSSDVKTCQLIPHWLGRSRVTSAMSTSSSTWGGRTSSCWIVSWSNGKLGGAVRITSELVAWSGTIAVRPTRPRTSVWALSATCGAVTTWGVCARCWKDSTSRCRMLRSSSERLRPSSACTRCRPAGPDTAAPNNWPSVAASSAALACLRGYTYVRSPASPPVLTSSCRSRST